MLNESIFINLTGKITIIIQNGLKLSKKSFIKALLKILFKYFLVKICKKRINTLLFIIR